MEPLPRHTEPTVILQDQALRRLKGFTQVPNSILRHPSLSYGAKLTFGVLLSYAWQDDFCFPAQEKLALDLRCSSRHIRRFLVELKAFQFIDWKQQGLNRPNVYYILPQTRWSFGSAAVPDGTDLSVPDGTAVSDLERTPMSDKEDPKKNTQHVNNVSKSFSKKKGANERPLTRDEYAKATGLALHIQDVIGQPDNYRSYFARAAEAVRRGSRGVQALMEVLSTTKQAIHHGGVDTTPSQYLHGAWKKVLPTLGPEIPRRTQPDTSATQADEPDALTARLAVQEFLARPRTRRNHEN